MLEVLRKYSKEEFYDFYKNSKITDFIKEISPFINKRAYFKIDIEGNINKKNLNYALPLLAVLNSENEEKIVESVYKNFINYSEKIKIKKIDRLSEYSVEKLKKNIFKIFFNRDKIFALRYSKEFFLKDKEEFIKCLYRYALINDIKSKKTIMVIAFEKLLKNFNNKSDIDSLLYCVIDYLISYESNFYIYENVSEEIIFSNSINEIEEMIKNLKNKITISQELELYGYLNGIKSLKNKTDYNLNKFFNVICLEIEKIKKSDFIKTNENEYIDVEKVLIKNLK